MLTIQNISSSQGFINIQFSTTTTRRLFCQNLILTRRLLPLDMISEFLAAISIKVQFEHFKTPQVLRSLDSSLRVYSLPHIPDMRLLRFYSVTASQEKT